MAEKNDDNRTSIWGRIREFKDTLTAIAAILALLVSAGLPSYSFWLGLVGWDGANVKATYLNQFNEVDIGLDNLPLGEQADRVEDHAMFYFVNFSNSGFSAASVYGSPTCRAPNDSNERNRIVIDTYNADTLRKQFVYLPAKTEMAVAFSVNCTKCLEISGDDRIEPGFCRVQVGDKYRNKALFVELGADLDFVLAPDQLNE